MEKEAKIGSGFGVSHKKSSSNSHIVSSMKMQEMDAQTETQAFPSKICMMPTHHQETNPGRPFAGSNDHSGGGGGAGGGGGGGGMEPTTNKSGANEVVGNTYRDDISSSHGDDENLAESTHMQPFDNFTPSYSSFNPFKSPDSGVMAANVGFPFTAAQWKELERQAMIYKYMISSVPVPAYLLFPFSRNFAGSSAACNGRYSRNGDPEPGRCKRTDGKKWRCSREVAPHQKYCERHLHRGRPRSRKPVEVKNNGENHHKKTRLDQSRSLPTVQSSSTVSQEFVAANQPLLLFNAKTDLTICTPSYNETNRDLSVTVDEEMVGRDEGAEPPWLHPIEANMGLANEGFSVYSSNNAPIFHQDYVEQQPWDVFTYPNFEGQTGFVDTWSVDSMNITDNRNLESCVSLNDGNGSPSLNLTMAMAAADVLGEEMRSIQMGTSVIDHNIKDSMWLSPVSWELFARGGPLGEALHPGSLVIGGSNPASPYNSISTPATTVSSPSGVLQRTLFSHSDGSVCNSPTLGPPLTTEAAIQWLN
ncbi:growth-regulating factor 7-like isoform X3 [Sesamum indicum]|uniref:Growth-regulating factor n=1 Tax=Sesamum indicum TaxID=4182 RepID=A0A6I9TMN9_SESIN|nr:growth-regulating factor 7-like isoform X3 [Sesamum indicum]